jgi:hypothetical protein
VTADSADVGDTVDPIWIALDDERARTRPPAANVACTL